MAKNACPLSRVELRANAPRLRITITVEGDGTVLSDYRNVGVREMSTLSLGYNANGKLVVPCTGTDVDFQVGVNITAIGSKELPPTPVAPPAA